ncbi:MAG: hypothetical protein ACR2NM_02750 [Bythopirellula sp.]
MPHEVAINNVDELPAAVDAIMLYAQSLDTAHADSQSLDTYSLTICLR